MAEQFLSWVRPTRPLPRALHLNQPVWLRTARGAGLCLAIATLCYALATVAAVAGADGACYQRGDPKRVIMTTGPSYNFEVTDNDLTFTWKGQDNQVWTTTRQWDTPPARLCDGESAPLQVRGTDGVSFQSWAYASGAARAADLDTWAAKSPIKKWDDSLGEFLFSSYPGQSNPDAQLWSKTTTSHAALTPITYTISVPKLAAGVSLFHVGVGHNDGGSQKAYVYWPYTPIAAPVPTAVPAAPAAPAAPAQPSDVATPTPSDDKDAEQKLVRDTCMAIAGGHNGIDFDEVGQLQLKANGYPADPEAVERFNEITATPEYLAAVAEADACLAAHGG